MRSLHTRSAGSLQQKKLKFHCELPCGRELQISCGLKLLVLLLAVYSIAFSPARAQITLTVGTNINISKATGNNVEECIAINPRNPLNLFASETWALVTKYSTDGGITWQNSNLSALGSSIGDVSAAF